MIAWNPAYLSNLTIVRKAKQWFARDLISMEQMAHILKTYTAPFYTPNLFVRIGLFIFTLVLVGAALGFFVLFAYSASSSLSNGFAITTSILFSAGCFVALEFFIKHKNTYRSGIDEALLYSALSFLLAALIFIIDNDSNNGILITFILFFPFLAFAAIRYTDALLTLAYVICLYAIFFLLLLNLGAIAKLIMPFALMLFSAPVYFIATRYQQREALFLWETPLIICQALALLIFYLSCNYFVIRESSISFFDMQLAPGHDIPLAFLFYILTAIIPIAYVYYALRTRNKTILLIGLILIAAAALTFKYYFSLHHPEITLTIAGLLMIALAYFAIRYLRTDKHQLTFREQPDEDNFLKSNAEALIIAQSFASQTTHQQQNDTTTFGGGSFGGGGAGDSY